MTNEDKIRIGELEAALLPFVRVAVACMNSYDHRDDLVVWRPPVTKRSKAIVTYADVVRARALLGVTLDN